MKTYWAVALLLALSLVFWWQPGLDHWVSGFFYNPLTQRFWFKDHYSLDLLRRGILDTLVLMNGGFFAVLLLKIFKPSWVAFIKAKAALYLLLCFLLAPALVVNAILKDHWGRPRPHQVVDYGGKAIYQPVWKISQQCERNCSFVCGDCAFAFTLFAFVPLVRRKVLCTAAVSLFGLAVSFLRVSAGGHFFSDALLSGVIVYLVVAAVYGLLYRTPFFNETTIEDFFRHCHQKYVRICS